MSKSSIETLMAKVKKQPNGCWEFQGLRNPKGYGKFYVNGARTAHRSSWVLHNGPIPPDKWVLHKCDNPPCCNPEHLFLGDHWANVDDAIAKGRIKSMAPEMVQAVRFFESWGASRKVVATKLGLSHSGVISAATRRSHRRVPDAEIPIAALLELIRIYAKEK